MSLNLTHFYVSPVSSMMLDVINMKYLTGSLCILSGSFPKTEAWSQVIYSLFVMLYMKLTVFLYTLFKSKLESLLPCWLFAVPVYVILVWTSVHFYK